METSSGGFYDQLTDLFLTSYSANLHHGYWDHDTPLDDWKAATETLTQVLATHLAAGKEHKLLDIGCGAGNPALRIAQLTGADVTGVTNSRRQTELATQAAIDAGLSGRAHFDYGDALELPYADAAFDIAWAMESMFHIDDRPRMLSEAARVLRPGGRLVISDLALVGTIDSHAQSVAAGFCRAFEGPSVVHKDDYAPLLTAAGLQDVQVHDLSEPTRPTATAIVNSVVGAREAFEECMGTDDYHAFVTDVGAYGKLPQAGYVIATALKPAN
ncbi:methyltransferase domain-containing protein [Streptomyces sp. NPDC001828]|uniref:methyltransferase domain-containing protein n=1 Tax=Streptomyces sp. NPDC001828 TaxID=3364615 RepID=UPI0036980D10